jgi:hypothetical protein
MEHGPSCWHVVVFYFASRQSSLGYLAAMTLESFRDSFG